MAECQRDIVQKLFEVRRLSKSEFDSQSSYESASKKFIEKSITTISEEDARGILALLKKKYDDAMNSAEEAKKIADEKLEAQKAGSSVFSDRSKEFRARLEAYSPVQSIQQRYINDTHAVFDKINKIFQSNKSSNGVKDILKDIYWGDNDAPRERIELDD